MAWTAAGTPSGRRGIRTTGSLRFDYCSPAVIDEVRAGRTVRIDDVSTDVRLQQAERRAAVHRGIGAYVVAPLLTSNGACIAMLVVHHAGPHDWTDAEITIIEKTADRTWDALERSRGERAIRESESRFRLLADEAPMCIWQHGASGELEFINRTYCEFFGVTIDQMQDAWRELLHPDDAAAYTSALDASVRARQTFHARTRARRADGQWRWIESWARPRLADGEYLGHIGASVDITERKRLEEELQQRRDLLEQRVAERTSELEQRARQLARLTSELTMAEQRERQRLARVLHDHLQQLLASARLGLGFLTNCEEARRLYWSEHVRSCLDEGIEAARDLSVSLSPPILHEAGLVPGLEWLARWMAEKHSLNIELDLDSEAEPGREDLRTLVFEAVRELLFNVSKHAGVDRASIRIRRPDAHTLSVTVADEGAGFDPAAMNGNTGNPGYGLFSIHERIVGLGGVFQIDSAPGRGSRFTISVPCEEQGPVDDIRPLPDAGHGDAPARIASSGASGSGRIRVLVVDDHNVMRDGLCTLLSEHEQLEVVGEASDGVEAVEQARQLRPDIVLMDYSMPRMNGAEATRRIRSQLPETQVVALTMYLENDRAAAMIEAGAVAYVSKSGDTDDLVGRICAAHAIAANSAIADS